MAEYLWEKNLFQFLKNIARNKFVDIQLKEAQRYLLIIEGMDEFQKAVVACSTYFVKHFEMNRGRDLMQPSNLVEIEPTVIFSFIKQLIPDISFNGSTSTTGSPNATFTMQSRTGPGSPYDNNSGGTSTRTATTPVEQFTDVLNIRLRGRSFSMKLESTSQGVAWKLGTPRIDIRPDGRK